MPTNYTVLAGQGLADIALQAYGHVEGVGWLLADNPNLTGPADRLRAGQGLRLREAVINPRFVTYLADYGPIATLGPEDQPTGIGYERVGELPVRSGIDRSIDIAPLAAIAFSSVHPGFINPSGIISSLPTPFQWGQHGWNDHTPAVVPDWVVLTWPQARRLTGATMRGLTNNLQPGQNPAEQGGYVPWAYQWQGWNGAEWVTLAAVADNRQVVVESLFAPPFLTNQLRLLITANDGWSRLTQLHVYATNP